MAPVRGHNGGVARAEVTAASSQEGLMSATVVTRLHAAQTEGPAFPGRLERSGPRWTSGTATGLNRPMRRSRL